MPSGSTDSELYGLFLKHIRERLRHTNILLYTDDLGTIHSLLVQAAKMNMSETRYSYLVANMDLHLLEDFLGPEFHCNITGFQLVRQQPQIKTDLALAMDAMALVGAAVHALRQRNLEPRPQQLLCDAGDQWTDGMLVEEQIRKVELSDATTGERSAQIRLNATTGERIDTSIASYLHLLGETHPEFIKFGSIGKTSEGRDMPFLTLGYPSASKKPALFVDAGIHAREWIAPAVALHFINALINVPRFHSLLSEVDVHVLPSVNPDGYSHTWTEDRLWRRTRSGPVKADPKVCGSNDDSKEEQYCYGVDPNRNFPFHWGKAGVSKCPCSQVYNGEKPLSEPECANLAKFISANSGTIKAYLTLHAFSNLIIHPYGFERHFYPKDIAQIRSVANSMAKAIATAGGDKFKVGSAPDILYLVSGSSDDFARNQGIKYTYTMELTSGWYDSNYVGFVYPEEGIGKEAEQVLPALDPFNSVIHPHLMEKRFADCFSTCGRLREPSKKYCFKNCIQG
uniref:Peptidase_M14 domain-containing protein n=1 Tax=Globodera pallida TaxID=36090 RepID=A0A183CL59_GLOPA